jgi:hypothetical protein
MRVSFSSDGAPGAGIRRPRRLTEPGNAPRDLERLISELTEEIRGRVGNGVRRRRHLQVPEAAPK